MKALITLLLGFWLLLPSVGHAADAVVFACKSNALGDMVITDVDVSRLAIGAVAKLAANGSCAEALAVLVTNLYVLRGIVVLPAQAAPLPAADVKVLYTFTK